MKRIYQLMLCIFMCASVIFTCSSFISAASKIAKVKSVTVSSVSSDKVTLKWKKVSGVTGYQVFRYSPSKKKYISVGKTKKLTYTVPSLYSGKAYKFKVRAYKTKSNKNTYGTYSDVVKGVTAPKKVTGLKATNIGTTYVELSWKKTSGATGYEVFVYDSKKGIYVSKARVSSNGCRIKKLTQNTKYSIKVAAYHKKDGKNRTYGSKSSTLTFRTSIPDVTGMRVSDVTKSSYKLSWNSVKGADGYVLQRYNDGWKKVINTASTSYSVKNLKPGTANVYRVKAYKKNGSSYNYGGYSAQVTANTLPNDPTNLSAEMEYGNVVLSWKGNGRATGYEVERFNRKSYEWETIIKTPDVTYTDRSLTNSGLYEYRVRAYVEGDKIFYTGYTPTDSVEFKSTYVAPGNYNNTVLKEAGILGFLYDSKANCFYTSSDPWQRRIGYNAAFDLGAGLVSIYIDTVRVKFEYAGKDWLLQLWKGQYGLMFYGAEVGLYNKPKDRTLDHFDCATDDELLKMSMEFYHNGILKFERPYGLHWWCTGFVPLPLFTSFVLPYTRDALSMKTTITMKDKEMLKAVWKALNTEEVTSQGVRSDYNGLDITIEYQ